MNDGHVQWEKPRMFFAGPGSPVDESEEAIAGRKRVYDAECEKRRKEIEETEDTDAKKYLEELDSLLTSCPCEPLNDSILVFPERVGLIGNKKKEITTDTGKKVTLLIDDTQRKNAKKATNKGTVIAVGPGLQLPTGEFIAAGCKKGDVVMYQQFGFAEVFVNGSLCHVTRSGDLLLKRTMGNQWRVFEPKKDGRHYIIGCDASGGEDGSNPASACVLEIEDHKHIAQFSGHVEPILFKKEIIKAGNYYNEAMIAVELEKYGFWSYRNS